MMTSSTQDDFSDMFDSMLFESLNSGALDQPAESSCKLSEASPSVKTEDYFFHLEDEGIWNNAEFEDLFKSLQPPYDSNSPTSSLAQEYTTDHLQGIKNESKLDSDISSLYPPNNVWENSTYDVDIDAIFDSISFGEKKQMEVKNSREEVPVIEGSPSNTEELYCEDPMNTDMVQTSLSNVSSSTPDSVEPNLKGVTSCVRDVKSTDVHFASKKVPLLGISRVKYSNVVIDRPADKSQTVYFATYSAKKIPEKTSVARVKVQMAKSKGKLKKRKKSCRIKKRSKGHSQIVLPVGSTGCVASIPAISYVDIRSFCHESKGYSKDCAVRTSSDKSARSAINLISVNSLVNQNSDQKESRFILPYKSSSGFHSQEAQKAENPQHLETEKLRSQSEGRSKKEKGDIFRLRLLTNPQNAGSQGTSSKRKKLANFSKESRTETSGILKSIKREFRRERVWPLSIHQRLDKIINVLKKNIYFLTDDILKQMSLPIKAVQRGHLNSCELRNLKIQAYFLHKFHKTRKSHEKCEIKGCQACLLVDKYDPRFTRWNKLNSSTDIATLSNDACNKGPSILQNRSLKSSFTSERTEQGTPNIQRRMCLDNKDEICSFALNGLNIGRVSIMTMDTEDVISIKFSKDSFIYEIELQRVQLPGPERVLPAPSRKSYFVIIEVPFISICGIQMEMDSEFHLLVSNVPALELLNGLGSPISDKALALDPFQISLVASLRYQLAVNPLHKLFLAGPAEFFKERLSEGCPWLRSSIKGHPGRLIANSDPRLASLISPATPQKLDKYILKSSSGSLREGKNCSHRTSIDVLRDERLEQPLADKPKVINIYSRDPFASPFQNKLADEHVWIENAASTGTNKSCSSYERNTMMPSISFSSYYDALQ